METGFIHPAPTLYPKTQDSLSDSFRDVDLIQGDELAQLSQAVQKTDLACKLGTEKKRDKPSVFCTGKGAPGDPYKGKWNK